MKLSHTEQSGLTLEYFEGYAVCRFGEDGRKIKPHIVRHWRHVDSEGRPVGDCYDTKTEALIDTGRYARRGGWILD
jgi:hypothetical protein